MNEQDIKSPPFISSREAFRAGFYAGRRGSSEQIRQLEEIAWADFRQRAS